MTFRVIVREGSPHHAHQSRRSQYPDQHPLARYRFRVW